MTCTSCLRALQVAAHSDYAEKCPGCQIRKLAHMPWEQREHQLDLLCHLCGPKARTRVRQELRVEMARIKKLRGAVPRRKERA